MGNSPSNNKAQGPPSPTLSRRAQVTQSLPPTPVPPRRSSRNADTQSTSSGATAPPPYTEVDQAPVKPPPPPPRDRSSLPVPRVSRRPVSVNASSTTPTSFRSPATAAQSSASVRSRTRSDSATQSTPPSASPPSSRIERLRSARPSVPPTSGSHRSDVGGFRVDLESSGSGRRGPGVGTRHAKMVITPPDGSAPVSLYDSQMTQSPVVDRPSIRSAPASSTLQRRSSTEDPLEALRRYDTVCIVDDSSSMEGALWFEARDALAGIADVAARYDVDGVDIHFLNSPLMGKGLKSSAEVKRLFDRVRPQGITPTGEKLEELLLDYLLKIEDARVAQANGDAMALKRIKPVNFLVITDGEATDDPEPVIVQAAKRLDDGKFPLSQVGIQFVQIGSDQAAADALQELDDGLASSHGVRDMVDTVPYSAEGSQLTAEILSKILLGGINRRQDRRKASLG